MQLNPAALKALRERSGLTQTELADGADIRRDTLNHLEHGRRNASDAQIRALAHALHVPVTAIINGVPS
jgi:transcriptional regulator with XRE-family HTH domain